MVGVVVVTHGNIGKEMVQAAKRIVPDAKHLVGVDIESDAPASAIRSRIQKAIDEVGGNEGVLILTDMFGGTPSNACLSFLNEPHVEVIAGVNLPMLIKLASKQIALPLLELVDFIRNYGQKNIVVARSVLHSGGLK